MTSDSPAPPPEAPETDPSIDPAGIARAQRAMRLVQLIREIEQHVATAGWDQNPRFFALALTSELLALEPGLAATLGDAVHDPHSLTPIEQEPLQGDRPLDDLLATTTWPPEVVGAAIVLERLVLPPTAETDLPDDDQAGLESAAASHPERQDVRMAVVVTRDGGRICALRLRSHDVDADVLVGEDLVPRLADALAATLT
ncbi:unannotated protein [freshwater metagenome]|uniref:Unannotated protein n=1 Tax=freshwater metagenome TaxID=449393 RepID=A0A6J7SD17_9ZZZZ